MAILGSFPLERDRREEFSESSLSDLEESSQSDLEESCQSDLEESSLSDLEESNLSDLEESCQSDLEESSLSDLEESRLLDFEESRLLDFERSRLLDLERSRLLDLEESRLLDFEESNLLDFEESSLSDLEESSLSDLEESILSDLEESSLSDLEESRLLDFKKSRLFDLEESSLLDLEESNLSKHEFTKRRLEEQEERRVFLLEPNVRRILGLEFESPHHLMEKIHEHISISRDIVELIQKVIENMEDLVQMWEFLKTDITEDYKSEEDSGLKTGKFSRKKLLMTFLTMIMFISHFLSMFISSRCKKCYVLLWTDKAVLLVLWTCGDVELNPGPNETNPAKARSQILREFRRSSQTMLLKMMYKTCNRIFPSKPYDVAPPGWKENKPDIEFKNISNLRSGDDKIFSKMIWLLRSCSPVPLSSEWDVLLRHYDNLNTKLEQEESKKALEIWMYEKKLIPLLQGYSENVDIPSVEIQHFCLAILLKVPNKDQPDVLDSKKFDNKDQKTDPNGYEGFRQTDEETTDVEMLPLESLNDKERPESDTDISACSHSLNQHCAENQSVDVPHRVRKKRKRTEESTSAAGTKIIKDGKKDLVVMELPQNQQMFIENHDGDTQNTTDDQCMQTCLENVDPTMLPCNKHFVESDHDCAKQISSSKDNCREIIDKETFLSNNLSNEEKHADKLRPNADINQCTNNIKICGDELDGDQAENPPSEFLDQEIIDKETLLSNNLSNEEKHANEFSPNSDINQCTNNIRICGDELDGDQAENPPREFLDTETLDVIYLELYQPDILIMYLKKYSEDLGDGRPSSRIVELCKNIVHKEHGSNAYNTDTCTN